MCKKTLWNFLRYYAFLFLSSSKEFKCGEGIKNKFYFKETYAGYELLMGIAFGISMAISFYFYDTNIVLLGLWNVSFMLIMTTSFAFYHWYKNI